MRQKDVIKKWMVGLLTGAILFLTVPGANVVAAEQTYTVTYRAGNVGCFAVTGTRENGKKAMAEEVAELLYTGNGDVTEIQVTDNGAIKLTVKKGAAIPKAPGAGFVQTEAGYFVKNVSEWGAGADETVIKNVDYVVDYGKLVNGVEYTVSYIDQVSSNSIAPISIAYGNVGDTIEITAPSTITISGAARYFLQGTATKTLALTKDSAANVLVFTYSAEPAGIEVNEIVEYEEGDTVIVTQTVTVPGQSQAAAGAVLAPGQQEADHPVPDNHPIVDEVAGIEEEQTPLQGNVANQEEQIPLQGNVANQEEQIPLQNHVTNPEEQTTASEGLTVIGEEQTALSDAVSKAGGNGIYLGAALAATLLIAVGSVWLRYRHLAKNAEETQDE